MDQAGIMRFLGQASDLPFAIRKLGLSATAGLVRIHLEEYGSKIAGRATASAHVLRSVRLKLVHSRSTTRSTRRTSTYFNRFS